MSYREENYSRKMLLILLSIAFLFALPSLSVLIDDALFSIIYGNDSNAPEIGSNGKPMFYFRDLFLYDYLGVGIFYPPTDFHLKSSVSLFLWFYEFSIHLIFIQLFRLAKLANKDTYINFLLTVSIWFFGVRVVEYIINYNWPWFSLKTHGEQFKIGSMHLFITFIVIFVMFGFFHKKIKKWTTAL